MAGDPSTPLILASAPNGAYKQKTDHPALPLSTHEIADCAEAVRRAGASFFHLHVRDEQGRHSLDTGRYLRATEAIKKRVGDELVIQITSEAGKRFAPPDQLAAIRTVAPENASLAVREVLANDVQVDQAQPFFNWQSGSRTQLQYILYNPEDLSRLIQLIEAGTAPRGSVLFVLGRYAGQASTPDALFPYLHRFSQSSIRDVSWMVCAFGQSELACCLKAAQLGGHARIGFENNLELTNGDIATDNAALIHQAREAITHAKPQRQLATASQARDLLVTRPAP